MRFAAVALCQYTSLIKAELFIIFSLAPRPSKEERKEGLVLTACAHAIILQILEFPIMSGYCLYTLTDAFTVKYMENAAHVHVVSTMQAFIPLPLPLKRPGDEAT